MSYCPKIKTGIVEIVADLLKWETILNNIKPAKTT